MGFVGAQEERPFADILFEQHDLPDKDRLLELPSSICYEVPRQEVCVQPKTRTPQVGCTLRSLSHNLALLPPVGDVQTVWRMWNTIDPNSDSFNLLVVPFPLRTVIRSVGPNLVIVLLMDGPQLVRRWPGKYATVLSDDPGSAVLTVTSLEW